MFTDQASFPLFTSQENLKVSNIKQKAGIKVDEQGSEAFAATGNFLTDAKNGLIHKNVLFQWDKL